MILGERVRNGLRPTLFETGSVPICLVPIFLCFGEVGDDALQSWFGVILNVPFAWCWHVKFHLNEIFFGQ